MLRSTAIFAFVVAALLILAGTRIPAVYAQSSEDHYYIDKDEDNMRTYLRVARISPHFQATLGTEKQGFLEGLVAACESRGGIGLPTYGGGHSASVYQAKCDIVPVVTLQTVRNIQDDYKKDVLDGINNMPQQLKDELRKVAVPEIEDEVLRRALSELNQDQQKKPTSGFSWPMGLISALTGAIAGAAATLALLFWRNGVYVRRLNQILSRPSGVTKAN